VLKIVEKSLRGPLELTALPSPPRWWVREERGLAAPPQEYHPRSRSSASIFGLSVLPPMKNPGQAQLVCVLVCIIAVVVIVVIVSIVVII